MSYLFQIIQLFLQIIGLGYLLQKIVFPIFNIFYIHFQNPKNCVKQYNSKKQDYVIVTGATDGIGLGFCEEFAKLGFNIILISRNLSKLQNVSKNLENKYQISTKIIQVDFLQIEHSTEIYQKLIINELGTLISRISILVNNVGTSYGGPFQNIQDWEIKNQLELNSYPQIYITKLLLSNIQKNQNIAIINVSSITGEYPMPYGAVYSGSKAFGDYFSQALQIEIKDYLKNIKILTLRPLAVKTPLTRNVSRFGAITPNQCANGTIKWLGSNQYVTYGHIIHNLQAFSMNICPKFILNFMYSQQTKQFFETCKQIDEKKKEKKY